MQNWRDLVFLHWRCDPEWLRRRLPPGLDLDLFDGSAWVGVTPFHLEALRVPGLPPAPWISYFPETNIRTYVRGPDGVAGIWFFTLECARLPAVLGARSLYGLPYHWAHMRFDRHRDHVTFGSSRRGARRRGASLHGRIAIGPAVVPSPLDTFLTARYRLYSLWRRRLACAEVEHPDWPLRAARVEALETGLFSYLGLPLAAQEPKVLFSPGVPTRIGPLHRLRRGGPRGSRA